MLPALLAQIGLPLLIKTVSGALEKMPSPAVKNAAATLKKVDAAITAGGITPEQIKEANRHVEKMAELDSSEFQTMIEQVNASLRTEVASNDAYVRRMRPTFGYIMAFTWAAQMLAIAFVIIESPEKANTVMAAMSDLDTI